MRHLIVCIIAFLLFQTTYAQTITISGPPKACRGQAVRLSISTKASFDSGNQFVVQVSTDKVAWQTLGSRFVDITQLEALLPNTLPVEKTAYLRVTTTSPVLNSNSLEVSINGLPTAQLISAKAVVTSLLFFYPNGLSLDSLHLNKLDPFTFQLATTGGGPYQITLNDSSKHTIDPDFRREVSLRANQSLTYQISRVQNECGIGTVFPKPLKINVNPVSVRLLSNGKTRVCAGNTFSVRLTSDKPLPANLPLYAVLTPTQAKDGPPVRVNASLATPQGIVNIAVPATAKLGDYHICVRSDAPQLRADMYGSAYVSIIHTNRLTLLSPVHTISYGSSAYLSMEYAPDFKRVVFDDGNEVVANQGYAVARTVMPERTTVYTLREAGSPTCGAAIIDGPRSFTVNVLPALVIDSINTQPVCVGTVLYGRYRANFPITEGISFDIRLSRREANQASINYNMSGTVLKNGLFSYVVPASMPAGTYAVGAVWNGVTGPYFSEEIVLKTTPVAKFVTLYPGFSSLSDGVIRPQNYMLGINSGTDASQFEFSLSDGQTFRQSTSKQDKMPITVYADKPVNRFRILSARNECGVGSTEGEFQVTVQQPTASALGLYMEALSPICPSDTLNAQIRVSNLPDRPIYRIEVSRNEHTWNGTYVVSNVRPGSVRVALPSGGGQFWFRVQSQETGQSSYAFLVTAPATVSANWSVLATETRGVPVVARLYFTGGRAPYTFQLSNGVKQTTDNYLATIVLPTQAPASYSLVSATDGCKLPVALPVEPFRVLAPANSTVPKPSIEYSGHMDWLQQVSDLCDGAYLRLPYIRRGAFPASARLEARLYKGERFVKKLQVLEAASPALVKLETDASPSGTYTIQLLMMLGDSILSSTETSSYYFTLYATGSVTLSGATPGKQVVDHMSGNAQGVLTYTEGTPFTIWLSDGRLLNSFDLQSNTRHTFGINQAGTYTIRQAVGECGYMPVSGQVEVDYKPALTQFKLDKSIFCKDQPVQFSYEAIGEFAPDNEFTIEFLPFNFTEGSRLVLARTKQTTASLSVQLPASMRINQSGKVILRSSNPALSQEMDNITVAQRPDVRLVPSETTIYAGQSAFLPIELMGGGIYKNVRFENGPMLTSFFESNRVEVQPTRTTTYRLQSASNGCGVGTVSGEVTVIVIPRPASSANIGYLNTFNTLCAGQDIAVAFYMDGPFNADNTFSLQLSDSTGRNYRTVATATSNAGSGFRFKLPADHPTGRAYRLRISSSSPATTGASFIYPVAVSPVVTGQIISPNQQVNKGDSATVTLRFTGIPPFLYLMTSGYYTISNGFGTMSYTHSLHPRIDTTQQFCLMEVATHTCGKGMIVKGESTMTVEVIGHPYDDKLLEAVVFPNPTADVLRVAVLACEADNVLLMLTNINGDILFQENFPINNSGSRTIQMASYPPGIYLLKATAGDKKQSFRVLKH